MQGTLTITFTSDWHCGTGLGRHGGVDRTVTRDPDGLPFVPAKTVRGLWRDACERAAWGLSDATDGPWHDLVRHLFGTTGTTDPTTAKGRLTVRPAYLTSDWRGALAASEAPDLLTAALVTTRYGVAVDETGVAEDDTLRLIERARGGLSVSAEFSVDTDTEPWATEFLLQAGARLWHHTGAGRRRGSGACHVTVDIGNGSSLEENLARFREHPEAPPAVPPESKAEVADAKPPTSAGGIRRATLTIDTLLPVLATRVVQGNVAIGHPFIPGTTLLALVAKAIGPQSASLIRDAHLSVTDATLAIGGHKSAPMPRSIASADKGREWRTSGAALNALAAPLPAGAKPVGGWGVLMPSEWLRSELDLTVSAHANIDDDTQRPLENGLYTFEAIPARTRLIAEVQVHEAPDDVWASVLGLGGRHALGRYRHSDFGDVQVTVDESTPLPPADEESLTRFDVWLTSDTHLLSDDGDPDPSPGAVAHFLSGRLGTSLDADPDASLTAVVRRESWTSARSLPRASQVCLAAGTVIRLVAQQAVSAAAVDAALAQGLGTLRAEGFGQARRLDSPPTVVRAAVLDATSSTAASATTTDPPPTWAAFRRVAWEEEILRHVRVTATTAEFRDRYAGVSASPSLRGSLREAAALLARDRSAVGRWTEALAEHPVKVRSWGQQSLDAVAAVGRSDDTWGARLAMVLNEENPPHLIPDDLGGVPPAAVAAAILAECLRQRGRADRLAKEDRP